MKFRETLKLLHEIYLGNFKTSMSCVKKKKI